MAVTVNYKSPTTAAATTPPTKAQMSKLNQVVAQIIKALDADTTAVITHNLQLSAAELALGFPIITLEPLLTNFYTSAPFVSALDANTVTLTLATTGGSGVGGAQIQAVVERPLAITE